MKPIGLGDVGPEVRDVQSRLEDLGFDCGGDEPAVYGRATQECVRAFQQQRGLSADGIVGGDTWRAIIEAGRTLIADKPATLELADRRKIAVIGKK